MSILKSVIKRIIEVYPGTTLEYPGAIHIDVGTRQFVAGDANPTWTADHYPTLEDYEDGQPDGGFDTQVPSTCADADVIATALLAGIEDFHVKHGD